MDIVTNCISYCPNEEIINIGEENSIIGILTNSNNKIKSNKDFCVIILNAGLIHKVGPNGLHVKIARYLALHGISSFRFDYSGLGDSENTNSTEDILKAKTHEIKMAFEKIHEKLDINKFILFGICTGAEDALRASLTDERIIGLILADGIYQTREKLGEIGYLAERNCAIRYYKKHIFSISRWIKIVTGRSNVFSKNNLRVAFKMASSLFNKLFKSFFRKEKRNINQEISKIPDFNIDHWLILFNRRVKTYVLFSEGSPMLDVFNLTISKQLKNHLSDDALKIELIKDVDHTFTPVWSQELLIDLIYNWIKTNLD